MHYLSFNEAMRARFGTKVYRLSLQSGCTCPMSHVLSLF